MLKLDLSDWPTAISSSMCTWRSRNCPMKAAEHISLQPLLSVNRFYLKVVRIVQPCWNLHTSLRECTFKGHNLMTGRLLVGNRKLWGSFGFWTWIALLASNTVECKCAQGQSMSCHKKHRNGDEWAKLHNKVHGTSVSGNQEWGRRREQNGIAKINSQSVIGQDR